MIGVIAGVLAGSIALVAFGLDSAIEGLASVIVIWRFTGTRTLSADAERRAQQWVAISFFLLAPYVAAEAIETLIEGAVAETSWLGISLTAGTLVVCPWLGLAKRRIAEKLGSRATYGEGTKTSCAPSSPERCWSGWPRTCFLDCGGLIRQSRFRSPRSVSAKARRLGEVNSACVPPVLRSALHVLRLAMLPQYRQMPHKAILLPR